ncbi:hypothetical protein P3T36_004436 [Kitasatospora sp. MAP12-15]|uniref:hypothetical protein n=1 Tax=unclassified Kitasatospora TaxID=2633591 RepID=UPI002475320B|nr:hypothetical protein [Kitasatospora sp. MAP12-44]MDH6110862.1 hypothetical protein [Kitasatospora sp. MAP12-44]
MLGLGVAVGTALKRLPPGVIPPAAAGMGAGAAAGVEAVPVGRAVGRVPRVPGSGCPGVITTPIAGLLAAAGTCSGVGQAVRLAGAPASTGIAVGRIPQPVASSAVSAARPSGPTQRAAPPGRPGAAVRSS